MRKTALWSLRIGAVLVAACAILFLAVATGAGREIGAGLEVELGRSDPLLFTVSAIPPQELRQIGPQALTLAQAEELKVRLAPLARMGTFRPYQRSVAQYHRFPGGPLILDHVPVYYLSVDAEYFRLLGLAVAEGRFFTREEVAAGAKVCVIGWNRVETGPTHSDPMGEMKDAYSIVGRLQAAEGKLYPGAPEPHEFPLEFNTLVLTPITTFPTGFEVHDDTKIMPLVAPKRDQAEAALAMVKETVGALWPGWILAVAAGNEITLTLEQAARRVESYFWYVGGLLLALFVASTMGFMILIVTRERKEVALRRSLGASRWVVLLGASRHGLGVAGVGCAAGLALVVGVSGPLGRFLGQAVVVAWGEILTYCGAVLVAAVVTAAAAGAWVSANLPGVALRQGTMVRGRRSYDVRLLLAGVSVALAVVVLSSLLLVSGSSLAALRSYLHGSGENVVAVRQDVFQTTRPLQAEDLIGSAHAALLRESLPGDWTVVHQNVGLTGVASPDGAGSGKEISVYAYALDVPWPATGGFAVATGRGLEEADSDDAVCLIGGRVAQELFPGQDPVGQRVSVGRSTAVEIVGVLAPRPAGILDRLGDRDSSIVVPAGVTDSLPWSAWESLNDEIWVYFPETFQTGVAVRRVTEVLTLVDASTIGFRATALIDEASALGGLAAKMGRFQVALGLGTLLITAAMGAAIMQTRVLERRREIGLRRALGARALRVAGEVLAGSLVLYVISGLIGLAGGMFLAVRVCAERGWELTRPVQTGILVFFIVIGVALAAGLWPASVAAGEQPMAGLREGEGT